MKKFAIIFNLMLLAGSFVSAYSTQQQLEGYEWAFDNGLTTQTLDNARLNGYVTRQALAKMIVTFSNMIGLEEKNNICSYYDYSDITEDLRIYATKACKLGLMGVNNNLFSPMNYVSKAQFSSILSRIIWGDKYDGGNPYYIRHLNALRTAGIMENANDPMSSYEKRGDIMYMLKKAYEVVELLNNIEHSEIIKQATEYVNIGKTLKQQGIDEDNRNKMRYGTFIEGKAQEVINGIQKGQEIEESTWKSLKTQLDEYIRKASELTTNDIIVMEAIEYVNIGKTLKQQGIDEDNRNKMRYGTFIEGKAQEVINGIQKGQEIEESTWKSIKNQLVDYIKKAEEL